MNGPEIEYVQSSFATVFARKGELAERFYVHLFRLMPEAESMFEKDFSKQKEMFSTMLTSCIRSLQDPERLEQMSVAMVMAHSRYNLGERAAKVAEEAAMSALRDVMGDEMSADEDAAWRVAITRVSRMIAGLK